MFLQILEDGRLTDSQGRTVNFKDTVIIMTSNAEVSTKRITVGFEKSTTSNENSILDSLSNFFKPEFLNRFDNIIEFQALDKDHLLKIVDLMLAELSHTLQEQQMALQVSDEVKQKLSELGHHPAFGARPLRRVIQEQLEDRIADFILDHPEVKQLQAVIEEEQIKIVA